MDRGPRGGTGPEAESWERDLPDPLGARCLPPHARDVWDHGGTDDGAAVPAALHEGPHRRVRGGAIGVVHGRRDRDGDHARGRAPGSGGGRGPAQRLHQRHALRGGRAVGGEDHGPRRPRGDLPHRRGHRRAGPVPRGPLLRGHPPGGGRRQGRQREAALRPAVHRGGLAVRGHLRRADHEPVRQEDRVVGPVHRGHEEGAVLALPVRGHARHHPDDDRARWQGDATGRGPRRRAHLRRHRHRHRALPGVLAAHVLRERAGVPVQGPGAAVFRGRQRRRIALRARAGGFAGHVPRPVPGGHRVFRGGADAGGGEDVRAGQDAAGRG
mmetsp:Transcript_28047/g.47586  ORF Transcript_28047/g.47586 Transcript_28047/m.47586 type:complete len:326 (+) Transcript_28047:278-1255(+)